MSITNHYSDSQGMPVQDSDLQLHSSLIRCLLMYYMNGNVTSIAKISHCFQVLSRDPPERPVVSDDGAVVAAAPGFSDAVVAAALG